MLNINLKYLGGLSINDLLKKYQTKVARLHKKLLEKVNSHDPSQMVDWYNYPINHNKQLIKKMKSKNPNENKWV